MTFQLTSAEQSSCRLASETLAAVIQETESRGYAVVGGLVSTQTCELLMESVLADVDKVRGLDKPTPHEKATGRGHLQLGLRRYAPYVTQDLVANPVVEQIVSTLLGPGAWLGFYNGNVNLPDSVYQPLHFDRPFSWRTEAAARADGQSWPPPTTTLSCSVALSEITSSNGATQVFPGTHHETAVTQWAADDRISNHPELIERWGPAEPLVIPAGGVCFRDPRMWHGGVPNPSDQARPMIALTYHAARCRDWRGRLVRDIAPEDLAACQDDPSLRLAGRGKVADGRLVFDHSAAAIFDAPNPYGVNRNARFVETPLRVNHFLDAHLMGGARVVDSLTIEPSD